MAAGARGSAPDFSAVGAFRRLLTHDLRLSWRDFRSSFRLLDDRALAAVVILLLLVMHVAAWSMDQRLTDLNSSDPQLYAEALVQLAPGIAFVMLLMVAQTLNSLTKSLYGRGDLDLLLSSPFPVRVVLAVRVLAVALGAGAAAAIFVVPVVDVSVAGGAWRALALLPALGAGALLAAGASLTLVMVLFRLLGPRRTRITSQIVATFIGGGFMIWMQVAHLLPRNHVPGWVLTLRQGFELPHGLAAVLWLPVRAAAGEAGPACLWLGTSLAVYAVATFVFGRRFAASVAAASAIPATVREHRPASGRDRGFATRLEACLRNKEWRLIRRDPWLLSQLLLQILYMTPMALMMWNGAGPGTSLDVALAPMIVVISYQVAASMTWLSLSGEDAPELLATAPVVRRALDFGKLQAVGELTAMLAAGPLLWVATVSLMAAVQTALLSALAVTMAMVLSLWHTKPAKRSSFAARHRESKLLALMEMVMSMLMGVTAALMAVRSGFALVPLGIALVILAVNRPRKGARRGASADRNPTAGRKAWQQAA